MWPRVVEFMLACYLAMSPFVFRHSSDATVLWASDFGSAFLVGTLAALSYWHRTAWAHWFVIPVGVWLVALGRFSDQHPWSPGLHSPGLQNNIVVGIVLIMFAIIPNDAQWPPRIWFSRSERMPRKEIS